jgi:hypothetical protein
MLADDESLQKAVCKALFEAKPLADLMDILKSAYEDASKGRAAKLIKYLVMHGPPPPMHSHQLCKQGALRSYMKICL